LLPTSYECTGIASEPVERTLSQQRNLDDIIAVTRIPERSLPAHLQYATFLFQDIVFNRLGGRNPFYEDVPRALGTGVSVSGRGTARCDRRHREAGAGGWMW
jgi:hypothetical protein